MLPDDSFIVKLLCIYRFYPDSIGIKEQLLYFATRLILQRKIGG